MTPATLISRTGWVAFSIGLVVGLLVAALLAEGPARCEEDEVATWPMEDGQWVGHENTVCVNYEDI